MIKVEQGELGLDVEGCSVRIAYLRRRGKRKPLVCLHGFGSTKEDYADLRLQQAFDDRDLILFDAPGFGASTTNTPERLSIPFLVKCAIGVCDALEVEQFHLSGHSMGGLTALMLAHHHPDRVLSFINIEGNIAPEDCFLSRQIVDFPAPTPDAFLQDFQARLREREEYSAALYALTLPLKVRAESAPPIFRSMVELSDQADLMTKFANLSCPKIFIYGIQNRHLSYLSKLPNICSEVAEIPASAHFPMYSNPPALWQAMASFLARHEIDHET